MDYLMVTLSFKDWMGDKRIINGISMEIWGKWRCDLRVNKGDLMDLSINNGDFAPTSKNGNVTGNA